MKTLLIALLGTTAVAQTVTIGVPGETSLGAVFSADAAVTVANYLKGLTVCGASPAFTLASGVDNSVTTFSITGLAAQGCIAVGMGILVDNELSLVTGIGPLVLVRARAGTLAATHNSGAKVTIVQFGSYAYFLKDVWREKMQVISQNQPGPALTALLATQQSSIDAVLAYKAALVQ